MPHSSGTHQAFGLRAGPGARKEANGQRDDEIDGEGYGRRAKTLRREAGEVVQHGDPAAMQTGISAGRLGQAVHQDGCQSACGEAGKGSVSGGAFRKHAEQESS